MPLSARDGQREASGQAFYCYNITAQGVKGRSRDDLLNGQRFEIVVFRLPWRPAAVAVRTVAVALDGRHGQASRRGCR